MAQRNPARDLIVQQRTKLRRARERYAQKLVDIDADIQVLDDHIKHIDQLELDLEQKPKDTAKK